MRHLVVTDIHGMRKQLDRALKAIKADLNKDRLIVMGDNIDYHRESREVLAFLTELVKQGRDPVLLVGNHEDVILTALRLGRPAAITAWLTAFEGFTTLRSYRIQAERVSIAGDFSYLDKRRIEKREDIAWFLMTVFGDHLALFKRMVYKHLHEGVLYSHGGRISGRSVAETEDWLYAWGDESWHTMPGDDPARINPDVYRTCYGHYHQRYYPLLRPGRLCLAVDRDVVVFCPEERLVVTSQEVYFQLRDDWTLKEG